MSNYRCPHCNVRLSDWKVERFDAGQDTQENQILTIKCPTCFNRIEVECCISVEYEIRETVPLPPSASALAEFQRKKPDDIRVDPELHCEVCGAPIDWRECRTAKDLMSHGWRVAPIFPGLRVTCPNCHGGAS